MDDRQKAIQEWKKIQLKRILLGVALTAVVVLVLWLTVGRGNAPSTQDAQPPTAGFYVGP